MKRMGLCMWAGLVLALVLAGGCVYYPISEPLRGQARPGLSVARVIEAPDAYRGAIVIWGGVIKGMEQHDGASTLFMESFPLSRGGKPEPWEETGGRFIINTSRYLDPSVFENGRWVTVGGEITGVQLEKGEREKVQYRYPIVAMRQIYLWPRYPVYYYDPYYIQPYAWDHWWGQPGPYHRPYWPYYYQPYYGGWWFW